MPGPRLTILSSTRICARSSETGAAQTGPRVVGRRLCHLRPRRRLVLFGVGESSLPTASDEMLSTLPPAPARHSKLYNTPLSSHDTITVMLKLVALLNSEWVGYPAYGLSEVKSSFPAIRKITVRMVAKRV